MAQTFESLYTSTLSKKLDPTDNTMTVATPPTVTSGRIHLKRGGVEELISFTWVSGSILTWLTRGLSLTADPATAWTGETWIAWTVIELVAMHDQLLDKSEFTQLKQVWLTFADTTARDAALWGDWVATLAYTDIYVTADWLFYNYNLGSAQWESIDTWTPTPNAADWVAGKVDGWNQALVDAGTKSWTSWADNNVNPETGGRAIQKQAWTYWITGWVADAYTLALTPTLLSYVAWVKISIKISATNTWASTINVDTLWVRDLKDKDGDVLVAGQLTLNETYEFIDNWTELRLNTVSKSSDAEAAARTNDTKYITPKQFWDNFYNVYSFGTNWTSIGNWLTRFVPITWVSAPDASEANLQVIIWRTWTLKNLSIKPITNTNPWASTINVSKNAVGSALTVNTVGSSTALVQDLVNTLAVTAWDLLTIKVVTAWGSWNLTFAWSLEII